MRITLLASAIIFFWATPADAACACQCQGGALRTLCTSDLDLRKCAGACTRDNQCVGYCTAVAPKGGVAEQNRLQMELEKARALRAAKMRQI